MSTNKSECIANTNPDYVIIIHTRITAISL